MPRERDPARDKAREIWEASGKKLKLCDIAEQFKVPETTVRAWKSKDKWDKPNERNAPKKIRNVPNDKKNAPKRKRGAQPGHLPQGGAPFGNINAVTNGSYMQIYEDLLTEEEQKLLPLFTEQEERDRLKNLYAQHQITERRLMKFIKEILDGAEMITFRTVSQIEPTGKKQADGKEKTKVVKISQEQETRKEQLRNFTDALTRVRAEMRRVADSIRQLNETDMKIKKMLTEEEKDAELEESFNDNTLSLAQILRQPVAPHEINIKKEGDED